MDLSMRIVGSTLAIASAALIVASCQTAAGPSRSASAPAATAGQGPFTRLAGNGVIGEAISGEDYCRYYAPDGQLTAVFAGFAPEYGFWSVDGTAVCETMRQTTGCSRFDFGPNAQVTMTSLEGFGGFSTSGVVAAGNKCGA